MIIIWENTDGCTDQYLCTTALYLLSMLAHAYNIIIDSGVGEPGHGRYFVDGLNDTNKKFLSMLTTNVKLPGAAAYELERAMHTSTEKTDIGLAREF